MQNRLGHFIFFYIVECPHICQKFDKKNNVLFFKYLRRFLSSVVCRIWWKLSVHTFSNSSIHCWLGIMNSSPLVHNNWNLKTNKAVNYKSWVGHFLHFVCLFWTDGGFWKCTFRGKAKTFLSIQNISSQHLLAHWCHFHTFMSHQSSNKKRINQLTSDDTLGPSEFKFYLNSSPRL